MARLHLRPVPMPMLALKLRLKPHRAPSLRLMPRPDLALKPQLGPKPMPMKPVRQTLRLPRLMLRRLSLKELRRLKAKLPKPSQLLANRMGPRAKMVPRIKHQLPKTIRLKLLVRATNKATSQQQLNLRPLLSLQQVHLQLLLLTTPNSKNRGNYGVHPVR